MRKAVAAIALMLGSLAVVIALWSASNPPPAWDASAIKVTIFWTPAPTQVVLPAQQVAAPAPVQPAIADAPTQTPRPRQYTVVERDTLWDIAVRFGLSLDQIIAANPGLTPELLIPGDVINVPGEGELLVPPTSQPQPQTQSANTIIETTPSAATVSTTGARLRLRREPNAQSPVLSMLPPLAQLQVTAHTSDDFWLRVQLPNGDSGWVMAQWITNGANAPAQIAQPTPAPQLIVKQPSGAWQPLLQDGLARPEPYLRNFTSRAVEIYRAGLAQGNNPNAFALVGDSNTATTLFFDAFDRNAYNLGEYAYLEDTIRHFKGSFAFNSAAAIIGINTTRMVQPGRADSARCSPSESPMQCEYRLKRPSVALILIGTNDRTIWQDFDVNYRPLIEQTIARGIVPVLLTKGDEAEVEYGAPNEYINDVIRKLSDEYGVPLLDVKQAISLFAPPDNGLQPDGIHYNFPRGGSTTSFTADNLRYGFTIRNLTALQGLDAVRRLVINSSNP